MENLRNRTSPREQICAAWGAQEDMKTEWETH